MRKLRQNASGFTLLEVLLALALLAGLLVALNVFVFSMAEVWGGNRDERLFQQHARAVTRRLTRLLEDAISPANGGLEIKEVTQTYGAAQPRICWVLPDGDRLLTWPTGRPLPDVEVSLGMVDGQGLVLAWQSRLEERYGEDPPRIAVISPFVVSLRYDYYDDTFKQWKTEDEPTKGSDGNYEMPLHLRLQFQQGKHSTEQVIDVPVVRQGVTWW